MRRFETLRWLMGKPTVPSNPGERIVAGLGLLLMAVGLWATWMMPPLPHELRIPASWWTNQPGRIFILSLILSIAHKVFIVKGKFVSPLGLTGVLMMMVVCVGQPLAMATATQSFQPLSSSSPYEWVAIGGLVVGGMYVDIFTWMYERVRQEGAGHTPFHQLEQR